MAKGTYYSSMSWTEDGKEFSMATQLYQVGLYIVINQGNRMLQQGSTTPTALARQQKKHIKKLEGQGIEVRLGSTVTATDESGLWEKVPDKPDPAYKPDARDKLIHKALLKAGIDKQKAKDFALTGTGGVDIFTDEEIEIVKKVAVPIFNEWRDKDIKAKEDKQCEPKQAQNI